MQFREWLLERITLAPTRDAISRCSRVENELGIDLDKEYQKDKGKELLYKLTYTAEDQRHNAPLKCDIPFKQGTDVKKSMASLKSNVKKYFEFCDENINY